MTDHNFQETLINFKESSEQDLCMFLNNMQNLFPSNQNLLSRYQNAYNTCYNRGSFYLSQFMEAHNEICVAVALLQDDKSVKRLEYEPPLSYTDRRFDFLIERNDDKRFWIEVKSVRPKQLDAWNKFTSIKDRRLLSDNTEVILPQEFHGGEVWHDMEAGRSRMLEYSIQTEEKIRLAGTEVRDDIFMLWFCMQPPAWNRSHLEDFVEFYRNGLHRYDDAFGKMEEHHLESNQIKLDRSINEFIILVRSDLEVRWRNILRNIVGE
jgi:hypothetical protein